MRDKRRTIRKLFRKKKAAEHAYDRAHAQVKQLEKRLNRTKKEAKRLEKACDKAEAVYNKAAGKKC